MCSECNGRHHTLLHFDTTDSEVKPTPVNTLFSSSDVRSFQTSVLMSTIAILVQDASGQMRDARALLDCASESSYVTENCRRRLGIARKKCDIAVQGMNNVPILSIKAQAQLFLHPVRKDIPHLTINVYMVPRITGLTPSTHVRKAEWKHLDGLELADPRYAESLPVDVLLGADVFPYITRSGRRETSMEEPVGIETVFGWILMGRTDTAITRSTTAMVTSLDTIDITLRRFWNLDEVPTTTQQLPEDIRCEEIYTTTTTRQADGRYVVNLPFTQDTPQLGQSRAIATQRLHKLEISIIKFNRVS